MMEILGEICLIAVDPSSGASMMTIDSEPEGAVRAVGAAPGGLIVLVMAPVAAESETGGGVSVPPITVRTPSTKTIV
jgi:hypothetical protein